MNTNTLSHASLTAGQLAAAARLKGEIEAIQNEAQAKIEKLEKDLARVMSGGVTAPAKAPVVRQSTREAAASEGGYKRNWSPEGLQRLKLGQIKRRQGVAAAKRQAKAWGILDYKG